MKMEDIVNSTDSNDYDIDDVVIRFTILLHDTWCNILGRYIIRDMILSILRVHCLMNRVWDVELNSKHYWHCLIMIDQKRIVNSTESNDCDIDDVVDRFTILLHDTWCNIFGKTYYTIHDPKYTENPLFNESCMRCKIEFKALLTLFNNDRSEENHRCMFLAKSSYVNAIIA